MEKISKEEREKDLETMNRITAKSKFTKKDIEELSEKIKKGAAKRFIEFCNKHNKKRCASLTSSRFSKYVQKSLYSF